MKLKYGYCRTYAGTGGQTLPRVTEKPAPAVKLPAQHSAEECDIFVLDELVLRPRAGSAPGATKKHDGGRTTGATAPYVERGHHEIAFESGGAAGLLGCRRSSCSPLASALRTLGRR